MGVNHLHVSLLGTNLAKALLTVLTLDSPDHVMDYLNVHGKISVPGELPHICRASFPHEQP